jgi:hypothetical protein
LADIADEHLVQQVATFVHEVERFKSGQRPPGSASDGVKEASFAPEFEGPRRAFRLDTVVESVCNHGTVVRHLRKLLEGEGFPVWNDRARDLVVGADSGITQALIEVKTSTLPSDIYCGVGQLMFHGISGGKKLPRRILVVPKGLAAPVDAVLKRLHIDVLEYRWADGRPTFPRFRDLFELR